MWKIFAFSAIFASFSFFSKVNTEEGRYDRYLDFIKTHKFTDDQMGSYKKGEIEIVKDLKIIKEIEEFRKAILLKRGYTKEHAEESSRIGILAEDEYWMWIRDAVIFPTGAKGTYNRIVLKRELSDPIPRVAMLPILADGRVVLNLNYRHALRAWVLEVPRGFKLRDESNEDAVRRQLKEETGYEMISHVKLGDLAPDSGCLGMRVPIYLVNVGQKNIPNRDFTEAILRSELFTIDTIKDAMMKGEVELEINGIKQQVQICDSYLAYAIFQAELKNTLPIKK